MMGDEVQVEDSSVEIDPVVVEGSAGTRFSMARLPSGCAPLDDLLAGGVEHGALTEVYGVSGSGKTNLVLQLAVQNFHAGKKTLFIDAEGISVERLSQIAGDNTEAVLESILLYKPMDFNEQAKMIEQASRLAEKVPLGLIVVDSIGAYYRLVYSLESDEERRSLNLQVARLVRVSKARQIALVLTNQVYTDIDNNRVVPLGGTFLEHAAKTILQLEKISGPRRRAIIKKHRSLPEGSWCNFEITSTGLE